MTIRMLLGNTTAAGIAPIEFLFNIFDVHFNLTT